MDIKNLLLAFSSLFAVACAAEDAPLTLEQVVGVWQHATNHNVVDVRDDGSWFAATSVEGLLLPTNQGTYVMNGDHVRIKDLYCGGELNVIESITNDVLSIAFD